jgi:hypothetical protein
VVDTVVFTDRDDAAAGSGRERRAAGDGRRAAGDGLIDASVT